MPPVIALVEQVVVGSNAVKLVDPGQPRFSKKGEI
jgi:hypothetical protein